MASLLLIQYVNTIIVRVPLRLVNALLYGCLCFCAFAGVRSELFYHSLQELPLCVWNCSPKHKRNEGELMGYTLGQAAEATGKAKSTILKSINSGRLSAERDAVGNWSIEPSELHRVYEVLPRERDERNAAVHGEYHMESEHQAHIRELQARVDLLERLCKQVEGERDNLREQNTRLTALLPAPKTEEQPKSLWSRLFGTKN